MTFDLLREFAPEDGIDKADALFSLHDVIERGVSLHWDEAVAIVEELCDVAIATSGDEAPVPVLEDVLMGSDGRITLRRSRGDKSPTAAGRMLHTLMSNGSVPMPLRLFATQSSSRDTHQSLREFASGLAYFGKPGRERMIQDVYARCAQAGAGAAEARAVPPPPLPKSESRLAQEPQAPHRSRKRVMRVALAAAVLGLIVAAAWIWRGGRTGQDAQGSAARVLSDAAVVLADLGQQVRDTLSPTSAAPVASHAESNVNSGSTLRRRRGSSPSVAVSQPERAPLVSRPVSGRNSGGALQLAMTAPSAITAEPSAEYEQPTEPAPEPAPVYSSADSSVNPPVLLFPQLTPPLAAAVSSGAGINRMVVVVSSEGTVERVQLIEGPARMPDMMLLSGAKTWRFTPAFKDGEPVRYRTVISWAALP
jgi:hypothetical protein